MICIPSTTFQIWPEFGLEIKTPLMFSAGCSYHLDGSNGSGKSSLITQILIPELQKQRTYTLYFEQQMHLQLYAIKAYAAIMQKDAHIATEADLIRFMMENLRTAYASEQRDIYLIADESHELEELAGLCDFAPFTLIYTSHHLILPDSAIITFQPVSPKLSHVYAEA